MPENTTQLSIMQDLDDPSSRISRAFMRLTPPSAPFDPDGKWEHVYHDVSSFNLKQVQGRVEVRHRPGGRLRIESFRTCPSSYRYYTIAELECAGDAWRAPTSWTVTSKVAKRADGPACLQSGLTKDAQVKDGVLVLREGSKRRKLKLPGRYTCKWCLLDAVGRLPKSGDKKVEFALLDEYDELCPQQTMTFRGRKKVKTRTGLIEVYSYQHTGVATVPGVFYVDIAGRVLFYLAGMQLLALADVDGKTTGYLK